MSHRILSGITPSGSLTLGNYLGALKRFADPGHDGNSTFFVADLHALTTAHDPARLRRLTRETALLFLASGIDPERSTVCRWGSTHPRCIDRLTFDVSSVLIQQFIACRCNELARHHVRPQTREQ